VTIPLNLKEIERKAFRSTYQDGLLDIYMGIVVASMAVMMLATDYETFGWTILLIAFGGVGVGCLIFWGGKKFITLPRMGQVRFGEVRQQRKRKLAILLGGVIVIQASIVLLTAGAWAVPALGAALARWLPGADAERLLVASLGALFVGPALMLVAYFNDFLRGYYIAGLVSLSVFLMILFDQPLIQCIAGGLIAIPGVILLVRFLQKYPYPGSGVE
jgi:hypothetical protein